MRCIVRPGLQRQRQDTLDVHAPCVLRPLYLRCARCNLLRLHPVRQRPFHDPQILAAVATFWPEDTKRTASCLYANVYRRRVNFSITISSPRLQQLAKRDVSGGKLILQLAVVGIDEQSWKSLG